MYSDLTLLYWWLGMKREILEFVSRCSVCQQVKAVHQVPSELLQPVMIPDGKWDRVMMDFVPGYLYLRKRKMLFGLLLIV